MTISPKRTFFVLLECCIVVVLAGIALTFGTATREDREAVGASGEGVAREEVEGAIDASSDTAARETEGAGGALSDAGPSQIQVSTIVLGFPAELGSLQRPAVAFNHDLHTEALEEEGCAACHNTDDEGKLNTKLEKIAYASVRDSLMHQYHELCMGCHTDRAKEELSAGPVTCGECHERGPEPLLAFQPMPFDYSLHQRHIAGMEEKCEECHHVYNERTRQLKYVKGAEDSCGSCHGDRDDGNTLSFRNAAHVDCVTCHLERQEQEAGGGPVSCAGCHSLESQQRIEKLAEVPRLVRGQKDRVWINALHAKSKMVPFDHEAHEIQAEFCTTCHRCTDPVTELAPIMSRGKPLSCKECHTENTSTTIERAFHLPSAEYSCIGCHKQETAQSDCAGCHSMPGHLSGERACTACHTGPSAQLAWFAAETAPFPEREKLDTLLVHLREKQATQGDFPEHVTIGSLAKDYEPVEMPHRRIVTRLDSIVRNSKLATHFHGQTETLCSSCHHHSPIGSRPTPCGSCHGALSGATKDMPALEEAYHRQCIGCHQQMGLANQGCTDCHAKAGQEAGL